MNVIKFHGWTYAERLFQPFGSTWYDPERTVPMAVRVGAIDVAKKIRLLVGKEPDLKSVSVVELQVGKENFWIHQGPSLSEITQLMEREEAP